MTNSLSFLHEKFNCLVSGSKVHNSLTDDGYKVNLRRYEAVAFLVGNDYNGDTHFREGIQTDLQNFTKAFKHMYPDSCVITKRNITKPEVQYYLNRLATLSNKKMIVVYFSGHGKERNQQPIMMMQDNGEVHANDVIKLFATKELANTKKMFLFDMCRSINTVTDFFSFNILPHSRGFKLPNTPEWTYFLIVYACCEGEKAYMYKNKVGSIFTTNFTQFVLANPPNKRLHVAGICEKTQQEAEQEHKNPQHPKFETINYYDTGDNEESKVHKVHIHRASCTYSYTYTFI